MCLIHTPQSILFRIRLLFNFNNFFFLTFKFLNSMRNGFTFIICSQELEFTLCCQSHFFLMFTTLALSTLVASIVVCFSRFIAGEERVFYLDLRRSFVSLGFCFFHDISASVSNPKGRSDHRQI